MLRPYNLRLLSDFVRHEQNGIEVKIINPFCYLSILKKAAVLSHENITSVHLSVYVSAAIPHDTFR